MTPAQRTEARELCEELPRLLAKASRAGMIKTARRLALAAKECGWELDRLLRQAEAEAEAELDLVDWLNSLPPAPRNRQCLKI